MPKKKKKGNPGGGVGRKSSVNLAGLSHEDTNRYKLEMSRPKAER